MPENRIYLPEGLRPHPPLSMELLQAAMKNHTILEGMVLRCDAAHTLFVSLGELVGLIPQEEAVAPWINGAEREISLLSLVGKPVCFYVQSISTDAKGAPVIILSRRRLQEDAKSFFLQHWSPGSVITARVTRLETFGAVVDIGCGIISMLPLKNISVSRIAHSNQRFQLGQKILAVISAIDPTLSRFYLTHKELLGTWMENATRFHPGDTVTGIVRSVQSYGCFVELTPNLCGLAERHTGIEEGDRVSVYLKGIHPESMKIKLQIIERLPAEPFLPRLHYQITDGQMDRWCYSPANYERAAIETVFTPS